MTFVHSRPLWVESSGSEVLDGVLLFLFFPEREVFFEELNDGLGISESLLVNIVDLLESVRQSLLSEFAGLLVVVHNFVMEDREVKGKSKSDWVAGVQRLGRSGGLLIVGKSSILNGVELITLSALSNVSVVITHHLVEESFGLIGGGDTHAGIFDDFNDSDALVVKLLLDLLLVPTEALIEFGVLWVLLDGTDGSNSGSLGANLVLETNREEVSLFGGEVLVLRFDNFLEVFDHIVKSLGLLGNSGHENILF